MSAEPFDFAAGAEALDRIRLAIRKAGPTSGLAGPAAAQADGDLARIRDVLREIAQRQAARREQTQQQMEQSGDRI